MLRHTMLPLSILLIGDTQRGEFREACAALAQCGRVAAFAEIESAAESLRAADGTVDLVVIAQTYPGQFSAAAIDRLRRLCPVARVVGLLGTWCEGETRTGRPWPGSVRVYWHQWPARADRELRCLSRGQASVWSLPATATDEERLLVYSSRSARGIESSVYSSRSARGNENTGSAITTHAITRSVMSTQGITRSVTRTLVAICTRSWAIEDWLSAACRACGHATAWLRGPRWSRVEGAAAGVFDAADLAEEDERDLRKLCAMLAPAPVIALANFPRVEDRRRMLAAGAAAVLSKPVATEDLLWQLDRVMGMDA
jgi:hypothetical protein